MSSHQGDPGSSKLEWRNLNRDFRLERIKTVEDVKHLRKETTDGWLSEELQTMWWNHWRNFLKELTKTVAQRCIMLRSWCPLLHLTTLVGALFHHLINLKQKVTICWYFQVMMTQWKRVRSLFKWASLQWTIREANLRVYKLYNRQRWHMVPNLPVWYAFFCMLPWSIVLPSCMQGRRTIWTSKVVGGWTLKFYLSHPHSWPAEQLGKSSCTECKGLCAGH